MPSTQTDRIDGLTTSVAIKAPCVVQTNANLTLSGEQTVNGVACVTGNRVLVKDQTSSVQNGIYVVSTGLWTRALDFDGARDIVSGTLVTVGGAAVPEKVYRVTTADPITIGTSAITFAESIFIGADSAAVNFLQSGTGAVTRTVQDKLRDGWMVSVKDFGAVCDDTADDTAAIQAACDAMGDVSVDQRSGMVLYFPGPCRITSTITIRRKSIILQGGGWGYRSDTGARRSWLRWDGSAGSPMIQVQDVAGFGIRNFRFIGKSAAKPSAAIDFNETNDGWPITSCFLENVFIGPSSGETDNSAQFTNGIQTSGSAINNSEHVWSNIKINNVSQDGVHVGYTNNVNIKVRGLFVSSCARAGIYNAGHISVDQMSCSQNAVDIYVPATDDASAVVDTITTVNGYFSEVAGRMAELVGGGQLTINGNSFSLSSSLNGDGKVIKAEASTSYAIVIRDFRIVQGSSPSTAPFLSLPTSAAGVRHVIIDNVIGWGLLTGGTNGMDVTTSGSGRAYVEFRDSTRSTGVGYPIRYSRNFLTGSGKQWDVGQFEVINDTGVKFFDDFFGAAVDARWQKTKGSDGSCAVPAIIAGTPGNGIVRLTTGADAGGTMALNGSQLDAAVNFSANLGPVVFECRVTMSAITNVCVFVGFTNQAGSLQAPFTLGGGDTLTSTANDAVGWLFDTAADTDNWWLVGTASNVDATKQNTGLAPVAATYERLRVSLEGATATFYRNGKQVGTAMSSAVSGAFLTPVIACFSRSNASRNIDVDYILAQSTRGA